MISLIVAASLFFILLIASNKPSNFIYVLFLLGPLPIGWLEPVITPFGLIGMSAIKVQIILMVLTIRILLSKNLNRKHIAKHISAYMIFILICLISVLWAPSLEMAIRMLIKLITPLVFFIYMYLYINEIGQDKFINAVITSGVVFLLLAISSTALGFTAESYLGLPESSRAVFSCHILMVFAVILSKLVTRYSLKNLLVTFIFAASILAAFTRITIAGMFLSAGLILFLRMKGVVKIAIPFLGLISMVLLFVTVDAFKERMFLTAADDIDHSTIYESPQTITSSIAGSGRFYAWEVSLERLFYDNKIFGSGIGATQLLFYGATGSNASAVHSEFIRLLCDVGVLGMLAYMWFWMRISYAIRIKKKRNRLDQYQYQLYLASLGMIAAYLAYLITDNGFDYVGQVSIFVFGTIGAFLGSSFKKYKG